MSWRGRLIFACVWILSLVILASLASAQGVQRPVTPSDSPATIVTVNQEPITQADLDRARGAATDTTLGRVLVALVDERLLAQRGKNLGYQVGDQQVQMILENIKKANHFTSDEQFDAALTESNLTKAQLRANLERTVIASRVLQAEGLAQISGADAFFPA